MTRIASAVSLLLLSHACRMFPAAASEKAGTTPVKTVLPAGVEAVWSLDKAHRESTSTRERVCLNGLWRWQPAKDVGDAVPAANWGFFKVPGFWPGTTNYIQEDCQTLHVHQSWKDVNLRGITAAWYEREITVPKDWSGRRIVLTAEYVNSFAAVYLDGKKVGELRYPAGEVDVTAACTPGGKHVLSVQVVALPLKGVMLSYSDTNAAREVKGTVDRRGLCGDVFLESMPENARIRDIKIDTSFRKGEITVSAVVENLAPKSKAMLRGEIRDKSGVIGKIAGAPFTSADLVDGRIVVTQEWMPEKLWDTHTPGNMLDAYVSLLAAGTGKVLDAAHPVRFGFREFWIDGKDFYLNGKRIFLSAVPLDNAQLGARTASYEMARETMRRLQSFGINFVYTHNYGCEPGSHVSFTEILRAADDQGMLVALSQPHFSHYDWKAPKADADNGYARHAAFYTAAARNHPSVVAYSMSHNATGYGEDMNPDMIDGLRDPRDDAWSRNNSGMALRAEAIVKKLDPGRIVYHHSSGNLGSMHTCNFYINFTPIQEMSDWFIHWSEKGVKPVFLVEYGVPFSWDWGMYRGWYKGERSFGSAKVPWEFCMAEWNAQFYGDRAYKISEMEKKNLRFEAKHFKAGTLWHRWDYPHHLGSRDFDERQPIFARYITENWRAFRTLGLSANSPWEHHIFWKLKPGVDTKRRELKVDWDNLQRPGFSADYVYRPQPTMCMDLEATDWEPTAAGEALIRNNRPLLAYIGGKEGDVTGRSHNYFPGESVKKQLIVINNSREKVSCDCQAWVSLPRYSGGSMKATILPGEKVEIPWSFSLPETLAPGAYELVLTVPFSTGEVQKDSFRINVLPRPRPVPPAPKVALFDPKGETAKLLKSLALDFDTVAAGADLSAHDVLIIGKGALSVTEPGPDVSRVKGGLKVIVFEQTGEVLERRFGFRVAEYGLRHVFERVSDHPLLAGLGEDHLHDWRGAATILEPRLKYTMRPRYGPTVQWCGIDVPRVWRCGNRGNVASVLIEKPARGDFLPILDGGYALQYSPLMEYREGKGMVLFCQMDVTGRTESDPAAETLSRNILRYVAEWKPPERRTVLYAGDAEGKKHFEAAGLSVEAYAKDKLTAERMLIIEPGGWKKLSGETEAIRAWLKAGGQVLSIGLDSAEANACLPVKIATKRAEHIAAHFEAPGVKSLLAGIGPSDVHNRDPRSFPLVTGGAKVIGDGILAESGNIVFCQLIPWEFDKDKPLNHKRTFRRASFLVNRLAANLGAASTTPLLDRVRAGATKTDRRWLEGFYLDTPEEEDDPYRFFRW